nr:Bm1143 [Brugia malayi]
MSTSNSSDVVASKPKRKRRHRYINTKHNKVVDIYNPYYNYFNERYKIRVKGRNKKRKEAVPPLEEQPNKISSGSTSGSADKVLAKK